jgi:hypothetical protein
MWSDLKGIVSAQASVLPIVGNDDTEGLGTAVDLAGYDSAVVIFAFGASLDTLSGSVKVLPTLQHSHAAVAGFEDVATTDLDGTLSPIGDPAEDEVLQVVGYRGDRRYLRAFFDSTGTHTNGFPIAAVVLCGHPKYAPA